MTAALAGAAQGQPNIPTFDNGSAFVAPYSPQALTITPSVRDLLGTGSQTPDGFAEIAVASYNSGVITIYRNTTTGTGDPVSFQAYRDIDIFDDVTFSASSSDFVIHDVQFANLTGTKQGEEDPDLLVAVGYFDSMYNVDGVWTSLYRGRVISYRAARINNILEYIYVDDVDLEFPATGVDTADFSDDGIPDVIVATDERLTSPVIPNDPTPARVTFLENTERAVGTGRYGKLVTGPDAQTSQPDLLPTHNVYAGDFLYLSTSGSGSSGNEKDFLAFGEQNGIMVGRGTGASSFSVDVTISNQSEPCGTNDTSNWFGSGIVRSIYPAPLTRFDPLSSSEASFATVDGRLEVNMIHYDPYTLTGNFYHRCDGNSNLDIYPVSVGNCLGGLVEDPETDTYAYLASGHLNDDTYEDIVHIDPNRQNVAFLLGKGSAPSNEPIMAFNNCPTNPCGSYFILDYAPETSEPDRSRVACADLNNDGFDEIIITHSDRFTDPDVYAFIVYTNDGTFAPCP